MDREIWLATVHGVTKSSLFRFRLIVIKQGQGVERERGVVCLGTSITENYFFLG